MRGKTDMIAPGGEVVMVGGEIVLIGAHQVQCIAGVDQAPTTGGFAVQCMTGTMVHHMKETEVLNMADIGAAHLCEGQEHERSTG